MIEIIRIEKINKSYDGKSVLKDVTIEIAKGKSTTVIGKSGAGKSTLLKCINRLVEPDSGNIYVNDIKVSKNNIYDIRRKIGMVFQNYSLFEHMSVMENLTIAPVKILKKSKISAKEKAVELLKSLNLENKTNSMPSELSGGEKQRVAIARVLAMSPEIILFDEPTSALDPIMTREILSIITNLVKSKMTMLIVTHEMDFAKAIADDVIFMESGVIVEKGTPQQIFNTPQDIRTRKFVEL